MLNKIFTFFALFLIFLDFKKPRVYKLALSSAFLFSATVHYRISDIKYIILTFLITFFTSYFLITVIFKKEKKDVLKKMNLKDCIGKQAVVKKDIAKTFSIDGIGLIEYNNELWQAKSIDDKEIKAQEKVEIVSVENMIMNVKRLEKGENNCKEQVKDCLL